MKYDELKELEILERFCQRIAAFEKYLSAKTHSDGRSYSPAFIEKILLYTLSWMGEPKIK